MPRSKTNRRKNDPDQRSGSDLPDWVSEELIQKTVEIWQPYYPDQLTRNLAHKLMTYGITEDQIRRMIVDNPRQLIEG